MTCHLISDSPARATSAAALRSMARGFLLAIIVTCAPAVLAADAVPTEKDAVAASRAVKLTEKLRCLVCQNQSIAESNAELAVDLRRQVNEQIAAGRSDAEIVDYMVARYGDFVLYEPPFKLTTLLLWAGPMLLLLAGFYVLARILRARRTLPEPAPLSAEERGRAAKLLGAANPDSRS
jgi:cytochrome c-type biogenesis protein CcmH